MANAVRTGLRGGGRARPLMLRFLAVGGVDVATSKVGSVPETAEVVVVVAVVDVAKAASVVDGDSGEVVVTEPKTVVGVVRAGGGGGDTTGLVELRTAGDAATVVGGTTDWVGI